MKHHISLLRTPLFVILLLAGNISYYAQSNTPPPSDVVAEKLRKLDSLERLTGVTGIFRTPGDPQNCDGAIPVCSQSYTQSTSYIGDGGVEEVYNGCLSSGETNSVWYIFTCQTTGNFGFELITLNDYDWALFDITTIGCAGVPSATPVRCNFSGTSGTTGMNATGVNPSEGAGGGPFSTELAVTPGETYALIIDNWTADANGYTLNFSNGPGYSSITDVTDPLVATVQSSCVNGDEVVLTLNEYVQCASISADGSDFSISGPSSPSVLSAVGTNCTGDFTDEITITFDNTPQITSGTYTLTVVFGNDGNTLLDNCDNPLANNTTANFEYLAPISLTPDVSAICASGDPVVLTAAGHAAGETYTLTPGGATNTTGVFNVNPTATTTYTVSATLGACTQSASTTVTLIGNVVVSVTPVDPTLCSGTTDLTATTMVDGVACTDCDYSWNTGTFTENNVASSVWTNRPSGSYTVTSSTSEGCGSDNTASTTVSLASAGGGTSCDVLYVDSYNGTVRDGSTKANPTSLLDALTKALCTNTVIKMQGGTYSVTDNIDINSYVTIEGGYNAAFTTKSSDMSSGTATTLVRTSGSDSDDANSCTLFDVVAGADDWRLQDLRIEMPDNSAGTQITNYGIYIPNGCTGYNIVRCYVDGGTGSDGVAANATLLDEDFNTCSSSIPTGWTSNINSGTVDWEFDQTEFAGYGSGDGSCFVSFDDDATTACSETNNVELLTPAYDMSGCSSGTLDYYYNFQDYIGDGNILVEVWDGSAWQTLFSETNDASGTRSEDLTAHLNANLQIRFTYDDDAGCAWGVGFDDIVISGSCGGGTPAGDTYAIYATSTTGSSIVDCQLSSTASTLGTACDLCHPGDASYTSSDLENFPVITAENISCENSDMDFSTAEPSPQWDSFGTNATATTPNTNATVNNNQYTSTGRKDVGFTGTGSTYTVGATIYSEDFESFSSGLLPNGGWTEQTAVASANSWGVSTSAANAINGNGSLMIQNTNNGNWGAYSKGNDCDKMAVSPAISTVGFTNLQIDFNWICMGEWLWDEGEFYYSTDNVTFNWVDGWYEGQSTTQSVTNLALPAGAENQATLYLGWRWYNDGSAGTNPSLKIDDIVLTGDGNVSTTVAYTYEDFVNITMALPSSGSILGSTNVCPGTYSFSSSEAGTPGYTYSWSVTDPSGETSTISTPTASSTDIDFTNTTAGNVTYTVRCDITSECCGPLAQVTYSVVITPTPSAPSVVNATVSECEGGSVDLEVSGPNATYTYDWYDAATGGTQVGTGSTFTLTPIPNGGGTYYVEATSSNGCTSNTRTAVTVNERDTDPTVNNGTYCAAGDIEVSVAPVTGTTYTWYDAATGGSVLQSSGALTYDVNVPGPAPQTVSVWVTATEPGCSESDRVQVDASITAGAASTTWTGAVSTDWFDPANWSDCVPNCATDALFPGGAVTNECNIKFSEGVAAGGDGIARVKTITINAVRTLTWGETKSVLNVCEDFNHNGAISMASMGKVSFVGSSNQQDYSKGPSGSGQFYTVEINNTHTTPYVNLTGSNNLIIASDGQLALSNGLLVTGSNLVDIRNTDVASITGQSTASYVYGTIRRYTSGLTGAYDFPVGNSTGYELMSINVTGGNTTNYFDVYFDTPANAYGTGLPIAPAGSPFLGFDAVLNSGGPNAATGSANGGVWTVTPDAGTANYDITLYGRNYDNDLNTHTIVKRTTAGPGPWALDGTMGTETNVGSLLTVTRTGYTGFSQFAIVRSGAFLPIGLLEFTGELNGDVVDLYWTTESEINNDYFTVERSQDGENFEFVGNVNAVGNSSSVVNYTLQDEKPLEGQSYYRLKQTDLNGDFSYSGIVPIKRTPSVGGFDIFPNPVTEDLNITFVDRVTTEKKIRIYDAQMKLVYIQEVEPESKKLRVDMSKYESGIYFISFDNEEGIDPSKQIKFVKQ